MTRVARCPRCRTPLRRDGLHLSGDDSPFCDLNELLRRLREQAREILARRSAVDPPT